MAEASTQDPIPDGFVRLITAKVLEVAGRIPITHEPVSGDPHERARALATTAARKCGAVSGTLALPAGIVGMATVLPDLVLVWRIQAQLVADIAGAFGRARSLSREHMLYCLFQHSAEDSLRDVVARVGQRYMVRKTLGRSWQAAATKIGVKVARESVTRAITRFLPVLGAAGVAVYAYRDTKSVADAATLLFEHETLDAPAAS